MRLDVIENGLWPVAVVLSLATSACSPDNEQDLVWPSVPDAKTAVIWDELNLWAVDLGEAIRLPKREGGSSLWAALYTQPFSELGLAPGALGAPSCERSCALLEPRSIVRAQTGGDSALDGWKDETAMGLRDDFTKALLGDPSRCSPCSDFKTDFLPIPAPRMIQIQVAAEVEGSVVVGTRDGGLYRIDQSLDAEVICRANGMLISHGAYGPNGRLWLAGDHGLASIDLNSQSPDSPCMVETSTSPTGRPDEPVQAIAVSKRGEPFEVWCLTSKGRLFQFSSGVFSLWGALSPATDPLPSLSRLGPGRGFASMGGDALLRIDNGVATTQSIADLPIGGTFIRALAMFDGAKLAILLDEIGLLTLEDGSFEIHASDEWDSPGTSIPYRGGLLVSMNAGRMMQYFPNNTFCPSLAGFTNETVYRMVQLSEDRVIFADIISRDPEASAVGIVTRQPGPCE